MARSSLEVADIFRDHGPAWRQANRGHVSLDQLKVMSAIERCRTAALGGHVARCENEACAHTLIAYNRFYEASGGERIVSIVGIFLNQAMEQPWASPSNAEPSFANRTSASRTI
jgi:Transposase zinc-binding domain